MGQSRATRPCPSFVLPVLLTALALLLPERAHAQRVLESGGVDFRGPSLIEVRSTSRDVEIQEVLSRAEGSGRHGRYQVHVSTVETHRVCGTPCRFELTRPWSYGSTAGNSYRKPARSGAPEKTHHEVHSVA